MDDTFGEIGHWIQERRMELSEKITQRHFIRYPEIAKRYGPVGLKKCTEDTRYHLDYLSLSIQMASPILLNSYIGWAKILLASYGIDDRDLAAHVHTTQEVLSEVVPPEAGERIAVYIAEALSQLPLVSIHLPSFLPEEEPVARLSSQYLDRLLEGNRTEAYRLINRAIENGMSIEKIYLEIFQPVQYEIGRLWQTRQISVAQEHLATAITQFVMARLYPMIFKPTEQPNRMVVTCIEEELHEIGARMVADVCELRGWQTYYLGGNIPNKSVIDIVKKLDAQVLGISITMGYHINKVIDLIQNVRALNLPVKIMVGGALFNMDLALWQKAGADGYAPNAALAVTTANQMVEQGRS